MLLAWLSALLLMIATPWLRDYLQAQHTLLNLQAGQVLEASRLMRGDVFRDTRVLLLHHDNQGALGVVLGIPWAEGRTLPEPPPASPEEADRVFWGGPVDLQRITRISTTALPGWPRLGMRPLYFNRDEADRKAMITQPDSPAMSLATFRGYAGWHAGQLEAEIRRYSWRIVPLTLQQLDQLLKLAEPTSTLQDQNL
jgi:putative transcriptional regulator